MGKKDKATQEGTFAAPATASSASSILGPLDVQQKEFGVARFGGYKMRDVDEFLDRITDSMSALTAENERLRSGAPSSIVGTPDLADVSRQADEIIARARAEAARIVADAKSSGAKPGSTDAPQDRQAVNTFLTQEREFLQSLAGLVQEHAEQVRGMAKTAKRAPAAPPATATAAATPAPAQPKPPAAAPTPPAAAEPTPKPAAPAAATPAASAPPAQPAQRPSEPTVRIEDPEPAAVGRSEGDTDAPVESDRSLRDLFWGED